MIAAGILALLADVSADGGILRGPVFVRADGRVGFGPRSVSIVDAKEGLERLGDIFAGLKKAIRKFPVEITLEKDADASSAARVLEFLRGAFPVENVPTCEWLKEGVVFKTPDFTLTFRGDTEDNFSAQKNARLVQNEAMTRRQKVMQAYQKALRDGKQDEIEKLQAAQQASMALYKEILRRIRVRK